MPHAADALIALGGAFLVCGLLARVGVRIGLPTIPLFMLAGVVFGPHTPGFDLVDDPADLELVARLGLVFLLFYLGLEFSLDQLTAGGRRLVTAASIYLVLNIGGGLASASPRLGRRGGAGHRRDRRASRRRPSSPSCSSRTGGWATARPASSWASS